MRDLYSNLDVRTMIVTNTKSATVVGSPVDLAGMKSCVVLVNGGTVVSGGSFAFSLDESDDGVTWNAVAAKNLISDITNPITSSWTARVGYIGRRRYIRPTLTLLSGMSMSIGVVAVLRPLKLPVA